MYRLRLIKPTQLTSLSSTTTHRTLFNASPLSNKNQPLDPSKQPSEPISKAKDSENAPTPAQQQANVVKQQNPGDASGGKPGTGQTQNDLSKGQTVNLGSDTQRTEEEARPKEE